MGKFAYLFRRIAKMNFGQMFAKVEDCHRKSGLSKPRIFFDMIYCGLKYQAGYMDYWLFEMYSLNRAQRATVLTRGKNNALVKRFNDPAHILDLEDKVQFNRRFDSFLKRDWLDLRTTSDEAFALFLAKHPVFIAKPIDGLCGKGIDKLEASPDSATVLKRRLLENKQYIAEELVIQHPMLAALHPYSVNTCRVVSISQGSHCKAVVAYLRIGNGTHVDNFNSGGMVVPIDEATGEIHYPALDKSGRLFEHHPLTGVSIKGFRVPRWQEVIELVEKAGPLLPSVRMVGWDVAVSDHGPLFIEANYFPGHDIYQLPPHRTDGIGVLPKFEKALELLDVQEVTVDS